MSQVKDIIDGIKHRMPDRVNIYPALNRAVRMISKRLFYHDVSMIRGDLAVSITAGASSGSLPSDYWGLVGKPYISGKTNYLKPIPDQRYKLTYSTAGIPIFYEVYGTTLLLIPGSSAAATVKGLYWKKPTVLTSPTDTMPFNELFDDAIEEVLLHTYTKTDAAGQANDITVMKELIHQFVDDIAPSLDKHAPIQTEDTLGLNYLTNEDGN